MKVSSLTPYTAANLGCFKHSQLCFLFRQKIDSRNRRPDLFQGPCVTAGGSSNRNHFHSGHEERYHQASLASVFYVLPSGRNTLSNML